MSRISPSGVTIVTPSATLSSRSRYRCSYRRKASWRCGGSRLLWNKSASPSSVGERETCSQLWVTGERYSTSVGSRTSGRILNNRQDPTGWWKGVKQRVKEEYQGVTR